MKISRLVFFIFHICVTLGIASYLCIVFLFNESYSIWVESNIPLSVFWTYLAMFNGRLTLHSHITSIWQQRICSSQMHSITVDHQSSLMCCNVYAHCRKTNISSNLFLGRHSYVELLQARNGKIVEFHAVFQI